MLPAWQVEANALDTALGRMEEIDDPDAPVEGEMGGARLGAADEEEIDLAACAPESRECPAVAGMARGGW